MDWERKNLRVCAAALLCALGFRAISSGAFSPIARILQSREAVSFYLYLQTGRAIRLSQEPPEFPAVRFTPAESRPPEEPDRPSFLPSDAQGIGITYNCGYEVDPQALLTRKLEWDLSVSEPTVLILHSHATESYTMSEDGQYIETALFRTLDEDYNMLCLGDLIARRLEEAGISVIHDTTLHDYPSYNDAYTNAAASTAAFLEAYPSIELVLDLHRDAADTAYGQMVTQCSIGSQTAAQLMMVVGTDAGGLHHPDWEDNLSLALKLQVLLEENAPGICRPINLSAHRYNQHLGNRSLLIEIGAAGNTLREARLAAEKLAQAIIALQHGTQ